MFSFSCSFFLVIYSKALFESYPFCFASLRNSISLSLNQNFAFNSGAGSFGKFGSGIHIGSEVLIGFCVVVTHIPVCVCCRYVGATYELVLGACGVVKLGTCGCACPVN